MSTVVCQQGSSHPCIESSSHVVEATTMRLKLVAPKCRKEVVTHNEYHRSWSFLESLSSQKPFDKESSYVHPCSLSKLTHKSLELCTESLGNETGSDTSHGNMFLFPESNLSNRLDSRTRSQEKMSLAPRDQVRVLVPRMGSKKVGSNSRDFPPPLSSISSSNLLHIKRRREDGRLIIEAVESSSYKNGCFQAERSHGRLQLICSKSIQENNLGFQTQKSQNPCIKY